MDDPFTEPIPKENRDRFVKVDQMLMWIAQHGGLPKADELLTKLKAEIEFSENYG